MASGKTKAIRCERDGLKMAEVKAGCLILRQRHHGEIHVQVVPLRELIDDETCKARSNERDTSRVAKLERRSDCVSVEKDGHI